MRRLAAAVCGFGLTLLVVLGAPAEAFRNVEQGAAVPQIALTTPAGKAVTIPARGQGTILFFWRPGQKLGDAALADLVALAPVLKKAGVVVLAITENGSTTLPSGIPFDVVRDRDRGGADALGVVVYPSTAVVRPDGTLQAYVPLHSHTYRSIIEAHVERAVERISEAELTARLGRVGVTYGHDAEAARDAYQRGTTAIAEGSFAEAETALEHAVALRPDFTDARLALGWVHIEVGDAARAARDFDAVLTRTPSPSARMGAGIARVRLGQVDNGLRLLEGAVELNPEPVRGYYELGRAWETRGDVARALEQYRWALLKLLQGRR